MTTPDFNKPTTPPPTGATPPPAPGYSPPPAVPTPGSYPPPGYGQQQGGYPPPGGYPQTGGPQPSWGTPPSSKGSSLHPALALLAGIAAIAVVAALYGFIAASTNVVVSYILIVGGVGAGFLFARGGVPPVVSGVVSAVSVAVFGFFALIYGTIGDAARQAGVSFGTANRLLSIGTVAHHGVKGSVWFFYAVAIVVSFFAGFNGGNPRRRRTV